MKPPGTPWRNPKVNTTNSFGTGILNSSSSQTNNNGTSSREGVMMAPFPGESPQGGIELYTSHTSHTVASSGLPPTFPFLNLLQTQAEDLFPVLFLLSTYLSKTPYWHLYLPHQIQFYHWPQYDSIFKIFIKHLLALSSVLQRIQEDR